MLVRILEPEVMDTAAEAVDYNSMDHSAVNRLFVDDLLAALPPDRRDVEPPRIFDAGTGTALIPLELMTRGIPFQITASDLAEQMLLVADKNIRNAGQTESIRLVRSDCKQLPDAAASYDAVMSNSIIHHIPEPLLTLKEMWRILKPGGLLFVRDLMRPIDQVSLDWIVTTYAGTANSHQQQMFRDSLHAALSLNEIGNLLAQIAIPSGCARATSDRHWTVVAYKPA
jgi:ubiquinone/menaquinone biosynthesis C-methylase UbiE